MSNFLAEQRQKWLVMGLEQQKKERYGEPRLATFWMGMVYKSKKRMEKFYNFKTEERSMDIKVQVKNSYKIKKKWKINTITSKLESKKNVWLNLKNTIKNSIKYQVMWERHEFSLFYFILFF